MSRLRAAVTCLAVLLTACGPDVAREAFVQRKKVDVLYGDPSAQKRPAPRPPGANPVNLGFPSFVSPPPGIARFDGPTANPGPAIPVEPPPVLRPCPKAPVNAAPATTAGSNVEGMPKPGSYLFRRTGDLFFEGTTYPLDGAVRRTVSDVVARTFRVIQVEGGIGARNVGTQTRTITDYLVDPSSPTRPNGVQTTDEEGFAGIKILRVTTEGPQGTDYFEPASPVRIVTLPLLPDAHRWGTQPGDLNERGADPLTGSVMQVEHRTVGHANVDVCGEVHQAWRVQVQGRFTTGRVAISFRSVIDVAPQFGGLVLRDELLLTDMPPTDADGDGVWEFSPSTGFQMNTVSTISSVEPAS